MAASFKVVTSGAIHSGARIFSFSVLASSVVAALALPLPAQAQPIKLDTQRINGELFTSIIATEAYAVEVISAQDLKLMPVSNVADALEWINGLDVRQRGSGGVQVDLGIRGAGYEQTLILVDGVRMNDPQTGHHNFNIAIALEDIERIEIVRGPGAAQYGPNGNAGVVNLVTRKALVGVEREASVNLELGTYGYGRGLLRLTKNDGNWHQFASLMRQQSDSYKEGAELDYLIRQGNYRAVYQGEQHGTVISLGYMDKEFGAQGFYTAADKYAREAVIQRHAYVLHDIQLGDQQKVDFLLNYRRHDDRFYYLTYAPSEHETTATQTRVRYHLNNYLSLGLEHNNEQITSSQVLNGNSHERNYASAFIYGQAVLGDWASLSGSFSYLHYDDGEQYTLPVLGISIPFYGQSLYANAGRSIRVPSMNDLHMNQPANKGNPDVKPEQTDSVELGVHWLLAGVQARTAIFYRDSQDVIDYTRSADDVANNVSYFTARNIDAIKTRGFDMELNFANAIDWRALQKLTLGYTRLLQTFDHQYVEARYSLAQLKHQAIAQAAFSLSDNMVLSSGYKYEVRQQQSGYHLWDIGVKQTFDKWSWGLSASNLLDQRYVDSGYMEALGRAAQLQVAVQF